jgi:bacterioferritin-associated ferredoxin
MNFMYVCICHAVTEKDIQKAVKQGICSMEGLSENMAVSTRCGCCADHAHKVLTEAINFSVDEVSSLQ